MGVPSGATLGATRPSGAPKQESSPKATLKYKYYSTDLDPSAGTKVSERVRGRASVDKGLVALHSVAWHVREHGGVCHAAAENAKPAHYRADPASQAC